MKVISDPKKSDVTRAYPAYTETGYRIPGAKAIRVDPITGQQVPIMLPTAEVYSDTSPLSGLQDIVSGSTYGQLAKSYQMDPAKLSEARTVTDLFAELTGVAGTGRAINRMTGGDTFKNKVFKVSKDDPTVDKAFDYMDLAATVPLVGLAAAGTKAGIKAIRRIPKDINADKIPYLLDKVMKENKAKGFYGGPFAKPYDVLSVTNIDSMVDNIRRGINPDALTNETWSQTLDLRKELDAMRKKVTKPDGSRDYSLLSDEDKKRLSKYMMDSFRGRMPILSSTSSTSEKMQSILRAIANEDLLKRYALGAANRAVSASRYAPPIRRVLQKGVEDAIRYGGAAATYASTGMSTTMRQALANLVERNPSISRLTGNKLDEIASQFGGDRGADYSGIRVSGAESSDLRAVRDKGEAPDLISAYMYGDFSNFYPTNVPNPDKLAKMLFGKYYDRYGDMEIRKMETKISSTKDKPLIIKEGRYGGLQVPRDNALELLTENTVNNPKNSTYGKIVLEELKIKSNSLASFSPERRVEQLAKDLGEDASTSVSRIFENIRKSDERTYNVILDDDNIPVQFQYLANENTNNPLSPIYDVAGHQMIWELDRVDGDNLIYKVTSADIWKFSSDDYVSKWGVRYEQDLTSKNVPIQKQSSIMDALGKPFVTMSENYIQIPKFIAERAGKEFKNLN